MFGEHRVVVRRQLVPQRRVLLRTDATWTTGDRLGGQFVRPGSPDVTANGGDANRKALGDIRCQAFLLDDRVDNALAQIK